MNKQIINSFYDAINYIDSSMLKIFIANHFLLLLKHIYFQDIILVKLYFCYDVTQNLTCLVVYKIIY